MPKKENTQPEEKLTPEQLHDLQRNLISNYTKEIAVLKVQSTYHTLIADVEEAKLRKEIALHTRSQLYSKRQEDLENVKPPLKK